MSSSRVHQSSTILGKDFSGQCLQKISKEQQAILDNLPEWSKSKVTAPACQKENQVNVPKSSGDKVLIETINNAEKVTTSEMKTVFNTSTKETPDQIIPQSNCTANIEEFPNLPKSISLSCLNELTLPILQLKTSRSISDFHYYEMSGNTMSKSEHPDDSMRLPKKRTFDELPGHILSHRFLRDFAGEPTSNNIKFQATGSKTTNKHQTDLVDAPSKKRIRLLEQRLCPDAQSQNSNLDINQTIPKMVSSRKDSLEIEKHKESTHLQNQISDQTKDNVFRDNLMLKSNFLPGTIKQSDVIHASKFDSHDSMPTISALQFDLSVPCIQIVPSNLTLESNVEKENHQNLHVPTHKSKLSGSFNKNIMTTANISDAIPCTQVSSDVEKIPICNLPDNSKEYSTAKSGTITKPSISSDDYLKTKTNVRDDEAKTVDPGETQRTEQSGSKKKRKIKDAKVKGSARKHAKTMKVEFSPEQFNIMVELIKSFKS